MPFCRSSNRSPRLDVDINVPSWIFVRREEEGRCQLATGFCRLARQHRALACKKKKSQRKKTAAGQRKQKGSSHVETNCKICRSYIPKKNRPSRDVEVIFQRSVLWRQMDPEDCAKCFVGCCCTVLSLRHHSIPTQSRLGLTIVIQTAIATLLAPALWPRKTLRWPAMDLHRRRRQDRLPIARA